MSGPDTFLARKVIGIEWEAGSNEVKDIINELGVKDLEIVDFCRVKIGD